MGAFGPPSPLREKLHPERDHDRQRGSAGRRGPISPARQASPDDPDRLRRADAWRAHRARVPTASGVRADRRPVTRPRQRPASAHDRAIRPPPRGSARVRDRGPRSASSSPSSIGPAAATGRPCRAAASSERSRRLRGFGGHRQLKRLLPGAVQHLLTRPVANRYETRRPAETSTAYGSAVRTQCSAIVRLKIPRSSRGSPSAVWG